MQKKDFLETYELYRLGDLVTELPNPITKDLSRVVQTNLTMAFDRLQQVDMESLENFCKQSQILEVLQRDIHQALNRGGRIFICGCGATGRLSLLLEYLWRKKHRDDNRVVAFMAGGDTALVHSLEGFEDYPEYGRRHLTELGFGKNDLLIASSEGGETPYVLGAVEAATELSDHMSYFLYCNPKELLCKRVQRSKKVLDNTKVMGISFDIGSMALAGSTRMQASTVLQLAIGSCLLDEGQGFMSQLESFTRFVSQVDYKSLSQLSQKEADYYRNGEFVLYVPYDYGITVFTDTTERSPTFSLPSFENENTTNGLNSLCYICFPQAKNRAQAWQRLLQRHPHVLNWPEIDKRTTEAYLASFDFSQEAIKLRQQRLGDCPQHLFEIGKAEGVLCLSIEGCDVNFDLKGLSPLLQHTFLKILLNAHSTSLMGLLGRYESNIMTWVSPTNGKLIDRAARYVSALLLEKGIEKEYLAIVERIFDLRDSILENESIVLKVVNSFGQE